MPGGHSEALSHNSVSKLLGCTRVRVNDYDGEFYHMISVALFLSCLPEVFCHDWFSPLAENLCHSPTPKIKSKRDKI